jgi:hypothetical protein
MEYQRLLHLAENTPDFLAGLGDPEADIPCHHPRVKRVKFADGFVATGQGVRHYHFFGRDEELAVCLARSREVALADRNPARSPDLEGVSWRLVAAIHDHELKAFKALSGRMGEELTNERT